MRKNIFTLFLCCFLYGCETVDYVSYDNGGTQPVTGVKSLYAAAVAYPEGYDWRRDSLAGAVDTDILFLKDGIEMMRVKVSQANEVSPDPDSHHIIDGHLYLNYANSSHTVIKRDGVELFRYEGRENIRSLTVRDTAIYTLGTPMGKAGWAFRKNGEVIHSSQAGKLLGGLFCDGDSLFFGAAVPIEGIGSDAAAWRYYLIKNGVAQQLRCGEDIAEILAVRSHQGQQHILERLKEGGGLLWKSGQSELLLASTESIPWKSCSFVVASGKLYAHVQIKYTSEFWNDMFFLEDKSSVYTGVGYEVYALCNDAPCLCFAYVPSGWISPVRVFFQNRADSFGPEFCIISPFALATNGNKYAIGLNDMSDNYRPVLVYGKDTTRFDFNGYFTELCLP